MNKKNAWLCVPKLMRRIVHLVIFSFSQTDGGPLPYA